ncbi:hypothetical protein GCM10025872_02860 [Barrientosiimonas endolithica]|uniref:Uncharacterized protein n=1 Tax=Barrientosiimonas endolithica TaxID=1535208 RepID=A0ABN6YGS4_9MICO|nr:hypothetical protein GCM10025872_02860 [Barrientosiimonas endolithica]
MRFAFMKLRGGAPILLLRLAGGGALLAGWAAAETQTWPTVHAAHGPSGRGMPASAQLNARPAGSVPAAAFGAAAFGAAARRQL